MHPYPETISDVMYGSIEDIDEELEKLRKRKEEAQSMIDDDSWGGLMRGSAKKAAITERERELLQKRAALEAKGHHVDFEARFRAVFTALNGLEAGIAAEHPEYMSAYNDIVLSLKSLKKEMEEF